MKIAIRILFVVIGGVVWYFIQLLHLGAIWATLIMLIIFILPQIIISSVYNKNDYDSQCETKIEESHITSDNPSFNAKNNFSANSINKPLKATVKKKTITKSEHQANSETPITETIPQKKKNTAVIILSITTAIFLITSIVFFCLQLDWRTYSHEQDQQISELQKDNETLQREVSHWKDRYNSSLYDDRWWN